MKTRIFSTGWSPPIVLLLMLLIGLVACTDDENNGLVTIPSQPSEVEQYIGDYEQMFASDTAAKRITISNLVSINDDPGFTRTSYTHQVHVSGLMGDPQELIAAVWDGHALIIDREQVPFHGQPTTVNGRLYLFSNELSVDYEMVTDEDRANYAEKYRKL